MAFTIALLGAECTGKSTLARQLATELAAANLGPARLVTEQLRTWCQTHGRTPAPAEQAAVARLQAQAIAEAQNAVGPNGWVVADTTPLQTAAYSRTYFGDAGLDASAADQHARHTQLTLLMGLDLPWKPDGFLRDGPALQLRTDQHLRDLLGAHQIAHVLIYGQETDRQAAAWSALSTHSDLGEVARIHFKRIAETLMDISGRGQKNHQFIPLCDQCDNAECEHRLFSRLTAARRSPVGKPPAG